MIRRRLFAAVLLYGFAIGSALFWNDWQLEWLTLSTNLAAATAGLLILHYRWRSKERRAFTPTNAKEVFK